MISPFCIEPLLDLGMTPETLLPADLLPHLMAIGTMVHPFEPGVRTGEIARGKLSEHRICPAKNHEGYDDIVSHPFGAISLQYRNAASEFLQILLCCLCKRITWMSFDKPVPEEGC
jgi:hypothetical protein